MQQFLQLKLEIKDSVNKLHFHHLYNHHGRRYQWVLLDQGYARKIELLGHTRFYTLLPLLDSSKGDTLNLNNTVAYHKKQTHKLINAADIISPWT